jgi:hypothetical protein
MSDINVTISGNQNVLASVVEDSTTTNNAYNPTVFASLVEETATSTSNIYNPTITIVSIPLLGDVDTTNKKSGSLLVYNQTTDRWTATILLNAQDIEAGEF